MKVAVAKTFYCKGFALKERDFLQFSSLARKLFLMTLALILDVPTQMEICPFVFVLKSKGNKKNKVAVCMTKESCS